MIETSKEKSKPLKYSFSLGSNSLGSNSFFPPNSSQKEDTYNNTRSKLSPPSGELFGSSPNLLIGNLSPKKQPNLSPKLKSKNNNNNKGLNSNRIKLSPISIDFLIKDIKKKQGNEKKPLWRNFPSHSSSSPDFTSLLSKQPKETDFIPKTNLKSNLNDSQSGESNNKGENEEEQLKQRKGKTGEEQDNNQQNQASEETKEEIFSFKSGSLPKSTSLGSLSSKNQLSKSPLNLLTLDFNGISLDPKSETEIETATKTKPKKVKSNNNRKPQPIKRSTSLSSFPERRGSFSEQQEFKPSKFSKNDFSDFMVFPNFEFQSKQISHSLSSGDFSTTSNDEFKSEFNKKEKDQEKIQIQGQGQGQGQGQRQGQGQERENDNDFNYENNFFKKRNETPISKSPNDNNYSYYQQSSFNINNNRTMGYSSTFGPYVEENNSFMKDNLYNNRSNTYNNNYTGSMDYSYSPYEMDPNYMYSSQQQQQQQQQQQYNSYSNTYNNQNHYYHHNNINNNNSYQPYQKSISQNRNHYEQSPYPPFSKINNNNHNSKNQQRARSLSFLEDLRNRKKNVRNYLLYEVIEYIPELCKDQFGSRFIQQKLQYATEEEKDEILNRIEFKAINLIKHVFGSPEQITRLMNILFGHILELSLDIYGCRVVQKAFEVADLDSKKKMVHELQGNVLQLVYDQNGNHVIQKCIECIPNEDVEFIIKIFAERFETLSKHPFGCRAVQRILKYYTGKYLNEILKELFELVTTFVKEQYGNYVIQFLLTEGTREQKSLIISKITPNVHEFSLHKFASNVVEKCLLNGTKKEKSKIIEKLLENDGEILKDMMKDQYGNYVVQKILDLDNLAEKKKIVICIRPYLSELSRYTYGKHVVEKIKKLDSSLFN
ncbi:pumilio 2 [Anaeramoeba flamelloides]|uniref:Pumilio 2 n=1 Tax=Anaeramoeba flamelloides TaxID=1746091 RepID=A0AAV8AE59_9EUKA|nr:pumilio 2 [Anaeramoeba flamelloides]